MNSQCTNTENVCQEETNYCEKIEEINNNVNSHNDENQNGVINKEKLSEIKHVPNSETTNDNDKNMYCREEYFGKIYSLDDMISMKKQVLKKYKVIDENTENQTNHSIDKDVNFGLFFNANDFNYLNGDFINLESSKLTRYHDLIKDELKEKFFGNISKFELFKSIDKFSRSKRQMKNRFSNYSKINHDSNSDDNENKISAFKEPNTISNQGTIEKNDKGFLKHLNLDKYNNKFCNSSSAKSCLKDELRDDTFHNSNFFKNEHNEETDKMEKHNLDNSLMDNSPGVNINNSSQEEHVSSNKSSNNSDSDIDYNEIIAHSLASVKINHSICVRLKQLKSVKLEKNDNVDVSIDENYSKAKSVMFWDDDKVKKINTNVEISPFQIQASKNFAPNDSNSPLSQSKQHSLSFPSYPPTHTNLPEKINDTIPKKTGWSVTPKKIVPMYDIIREQEFEKIYLEKEKQFKNQQEKLLENEKQRNPWKSVHTSPTLSFEQIEQEELQKLRMNELQMTRNKLKIKKNVKSNAWFQSESDIIKTDTDWNQYGLDILVKLKNCPVNPRGYLMRLFNWELECQVIDDIRNTLGCTIEVSKFSKKFCQQRFTK